MVPQTQPSLTSVGAGNIYSGTKRVTVAWEHSWRLPRILCSTVTWPPRFVVTLFKLMVELPLQKEEESPAVDVRCQPRALLAFGLVPGLYILKDFLNSHKDKAACRDDFNGCKGTEVVCN